MTDLEFDLTKKKKKSKKVDDNSSSSVTESTPRPSNDSNDIDDILVSMKKKKKSKKLAESSEHESPSSAQEDLSSSFGDLSLKKKKKKSSKNTGASDFEQQLEEAGLESQKEVSEEVAQENEEAYENLLDRFFAILKEKNPELAGERSGPKFRIPPPVCQREGSKKTLFANVQDISSVLHRNPEHLIQFLFAELGTSGSIDGEKRLVLRGKFQSKQMESVLRRYIIEYVTCKTCKSMNTELKRESANRLHFLSCNACGSTRSVSSIKTGFQAQIGRRKKL